MKKSSGTSSKKDYPILLFLLCGIMLQVVTSCSNRNVPLKSVSFDNINREITLKLSNLLQEIQFVPLETNPEFLLGNVSRIAITDQYILTIEQTKVCQFSRQGKFIRQLMVRGNGPNEFNTVVFPVTVPGSELFYYMDWGKDITHTYRINLETGEHLPPFNPGSDYYCLYAADRKGNLYCIPNSGMRAPSYPNPDTLNIAFRYHPDKNLRHSYSSGQSYLLNMDNNALISNGKEILCLNHNYSDTLFSIQERRLQPLCRILLESHTKPDGKTGSNLSLKFINKLSYIFLKLDSKFEVNEAGKIIGRNVFSSEYLYLDKQYNVSKIKSIDLMGHILLPGQPNELNLQAIPGVSGEYGYYILDAPAYKKLYPESAVREDDNPVILIGKLY